MNLRCFRKAFGHFFLYAYSLGHVFIHNLQTKITYRLNYSIYKQKCQKAESKFFVDPD
jgi:hypothetical protein